MSSYIDDFMAFFGGGSEEIPKESKPPKPKGPSPSWDKAPSPTGTPKVTSMPHQRFPSPNVPKGPQMNLPLNQVKDVPLPFGKKSVLEQAMDSGAGKRIPKVAKKLLGPAGVVLDAITPSELGDSSLKEGDPVPPLAEGVIPMTDEQVEAYKEMYGSTPYHMSDEQRSQSQLSPIPPEVTIPENTVAGLQQRMLENTKGYTSIEEVPDENLEATVVNIEAEVERLTKLRDAAEARGDQGAVMTLDKLIEEQQTSMNPITTEQGRRNVVKDPDNNTVIKQASTMNYDQLRADYEEMYEGEKIWEQVKKAGESAGDAAAGGHSIKDALSKASSYLGDLFGDKSIQRALIYYAGARLMGYSGSGSGMAAGQVLMQGWENETKEELALGKEKREAYAKSAEAKAVDQTKTVDFWQKGGKKKITGYMSKDGSLFYQVNDAGVLSKNPINPARQGLVTYNKTAHKTFDQLDADIKTSSVESSQDVLRTVLGNSSLDEENLRVTSDIFGDGRVVRDLTNTITRELRASGSDYNDPRIQDAINNLVSNAIWAQAEGRRTGSHQEIIKGLTGEWREHQLKHSLTGEGSIPKFVYSKVTEWGSDGKPTKIDDEFNATAPKKAIFSERLDAIRMKWVAIAEGNNVPQVEALSKITPTRITQEMAKLFKNTVMKDKNARIYWTENAVDQTAFMLWLSAPSDTEEKYMAPSSEAVKKVIGKTPSLEKLFN